MTTPGVPQSDALTAATDALSAAHPGVRISHIAPMPEATTHALFAIDALTPDGDELLLVLKDLDPSSTLAAMVGTRPDFVSDPAREPAVYRSGAATSFRPACIAASPARAQERAWVLIERIIGRELWQRGDLAAWQAAASAMAAIHGAELAPAAPLLRHDPALWATWAERAETLSGECVRPAVQALTRRCRSLPDRLQGLPTSFIHGEAYASNILLGEDDRIAFIDWEMAATGPALFDLACLVEGWKEQTIRRLAMAYRKALPAEELRLRSEKEFLDALDACRLQLCLQWLGWSAGWVPPERHRQNWLGLGLRLADRIGL